MWKLFFITVMGLTLSSCQLIPPANAQDAETRTARSYLKLGYTNRGVCPSKWILRNRNRDQPITATIEYRFEHNVLFSRQPPSPETEQVFVAPGESKQLKYYYNQCANGDVGARLVGAYFGR